MMLLNNHLLNLTLNISSLFQYNETIDQNLQVKITKLPKQIDMEVINIKKVTENSQPKLYIIILLAISAAIMTLLSIFVILRLRHRRSRRQPEIQTTYIRILQIKQLKKIDIYEIGI